VSPIATFDLAPGGVRLDAAAVNGSDLAADGRLRFTAGDRRAALAALDAGNATILSRSTAERLGLGLGDALAVALADGTRAELEVVGIVERSIPGRAGEAILVGWADAGARFGVRGADFFAVRFGPEATEAARAELESVARTLALEPNPLSRVQGAVADALGRVFGLFDAIALVAVLIAGLGIVNTLTMSVSERVRELGLLRALGMSRRGASRMVVVEAGVLGLVGAALGVATGLGVGWLLLALGDADAGRFELPWASIAVAAVLGVAISLAAAWWPARLASRVSIVRALAYE
jgi:putative ABC transport system permease protein